MNGPTTWKEALQGRMPEYLAEEINVFEGQIERESLLGLRVTQPGKEAVRPLGGTPPDNGIA